MSFWKAGVHERALLVDASAEWRDDTVDDETQLLFGIVVLVALAYDAVALEEDGVGPVDHDLGNRVIFEHLLDGTQAEHHVERALDEDGTIDVVHGCEIMRAQNLLDADGELLSRTLAPLVQKLRDALARDFAVQQLA